MRVGKNILGFLLSGIIMILAACTPSADGIPVTGDTETPGETTVSPIMPQETLLNAQQWLSAQLSVAAEQIQIVEVEQAEWTDSCLGLGRLNESCLQAITPGWRAVFEVNGVTYEIRTDETGSIIRLAPSEGAAENNLENTHWTLVAFGPPDGEHPLPVANIILLMANGQAGGFGGCNAYGTTYQIDGNTITFGEITSTLRACEDSDLTDQEQRYFQALESASQFERQDNLLLLSDDSGTTVLTFETPLTAYPNPYP